MPKDSIKRLLDKFPHFIDKRPISNFFKSQSVTNEQFKDIYQSLFNVFESFQLDKRLVIWKVQDEPYIYTINFVASYPHLKTVKCYKNDGLIYLETYEDSEEITNFVYSYDYPQENNSLQNILEDNEGGNEETINIPPGAKIIPDDQFRIELETYNELVLEKGFPENDTEEGNVYDHDYSLDEFGALHNIPRRTYIETPDYQNTEPSYNNKLTEDDYHYMNRIINYLVMIRTAPLPIAEVYKLYGIRAQMQNRERLLLKMFDIERHPHTKNEDGNLHVCGWDAEQWEHKDGFCQKAYNNKIFFFARADNIQPKLFHPVTFYFSFLDMFADPIEDKGFLVDIDLTVPDLNGGTTTSQVKTDVKESYYTYNDFVEEISFYTFTFTGKTANGTVIGVVSIDIHILGCDDGDFYVSANGDDSNDGTTKETPFKTITKAISKLSSAQDLIIVLGTIELDKLNTISMPCTIMGCSKGTIHSNFDHNKFFHTSKDNTINLTNISLTHNYAESYFKCEDYSNENDTLSNVETVIMHGGTPPLTLTAQKNNFYHYYDNVHLIGDFLNRKDHPIKNTELDLYIDDVKLKTITTTDEGKIDEWFHYENLSKNTQKTYKVTFSGSDVHYETEASASIIFSKDTPQLDQIRYGRLLTITSTNYEKNETFGLYERIPNGLNLRKQRESNANGEISFTYLPSYGQQLIVISEDGMNIIEEFLIEVRFYISDLETEYLVTDVEVDNNAGDGKLYVTKTPLSDFRTLSDLQNAIVDLTIDDEGNFYKEYFVSNHQDLLNGNEIYPDDLEIMKNAITDVMFSDEEGHEGDLYCERITIEMEEES